MVLIDFLEFYRLFLRLFDKSCVFWWYLDPVHVFYILLLCDDIPSAPRYVNFFKPFRFLTGDQLVVPIGLSHISS